MSWTSLSVCPTETRLLVECPLGFAGSGALEAVPVALAVPGPPGYVGHATLRPLPGWVPSLRALPAGLGDFAYDASSLRPVEVYSQFAPRTTVAIENQFDALVSDRDSALSDSSDSDFEDIH